MEPANVEAAAMTFLKKICQDATSSERTLAQPAMFHQEFSRCQQFQAKCLLKNWDVPPPSKNGTQ